MTVRSLSEIYRSLSYLEERQSVLSRNIANVNTPGYHSFELEPLQLKDRKPFPSESLLLQSDQGVSFQDHFLFYRSESGVSVDKVRSNLWDSPRVTRSGHTVSTEDEVAEVSAVAHDHEERVAVLKKLLRLYHVVLSDL